MFNNSNFQNPSQKQHILNLFNYLFWWNLFDSVGTQFLLIPHHYLMRKLVSIIIHGSYGCILGLLYFIITLFNFGLNYSLGPYITKIINSKKSFRNFFYKQVLSQVFIILFFAVIFIVFAPINQFNKLVSNIIIDKLFLIIISCAFISESIKKILKTFLQFVYQSKTTAIIDNLGMIFHLSLFWVGYLLGLQITLHYCFTILAITSILQLVSLSFYILKFYNSLPNKCNTNFDTKDIIKTRSFIWANQSLNQVFSTNFLVPLSGYFLGVNQASILKIASSIVNLINIVVQRAFGISSYALLANAKNFGIEQRKEFFQWLYHILQQISLGIVIFFIFNNLKFLHSLQNSHSNILVINLVLIVIIQGLLSLYEKWFITENKSGRLLISNFLITTTIVLGSIIFTKSHSNLDLVIIFLSAILGSRILFFVYLINYSISFWKLKPNFSLKLSTIFTSLALSTGYLIFAKYIQPSIVSFF